ncbi:helix-turn-helix transcriptional regulator [Rhizobium leguminosarum]|uniref:helix-turn-helix transcriptional regulator n=1 Tax=Rhizobium leguminosarum TaxID=384 RepID=UPI001FE008DC|nr:helix-turn-helix transcriptional regulator [Rhizobium leguminosarum]
MVTVNIGAGAELLISVDWQTCIDVTRMQTWLTDPEERTRMVSSLRDPELGHFSTWREESDFLRRAGAPSQSPGTTGRRAHQSGDRDGAKPRERQRLSPAGGGNSGNGCRLERRPACPGARIFPAAIARARSHQVPQLFQDEGLEFSTVVRAIVRRFGLKVFSADAVDFIGDIIGQGEKSALSKPADNGRRIKGPLAGGKNLLSQREQLVLLCLHEGKSNKEIARALGLSEPTVKFHLKNVFSKLGVSRRAMALAVSAKLNLR